MPFELFADSACGLRLTSRFMLKDCALLVVIGAFVPSRIICLLLGFGFDSQMTIQGFWQIAEPDLLQHDLVRTL